MQNESNRRTVEQRNSRSNRTNVSTNSTGHSRSYAQGRYWMLTIPRAEWEVPETLPDGVTWIKGQVERGAGTSYEHWQAVVGFSKKVRLTRVKAVFGDQCHAELTRSEAAEDYVWKEETRVEGTQFEIGRKAIKRGNQVDWDRVLNLAKGGTLDEIPSDILVRYYGQINRIAVDFSQPVGIEKQVFVYWGKTGTGKSRRAWEGAGLDAFPKDPKTKFWCGYRHHEHVVIDEFRGGIDICHILRWLDRYPVIVEVKGGAQVLKAKKIWITSNLHPKDWYPTLDQETMDALLRRLQITQFLTNELT